MRSAMRRQEKTHPTHPVPPNLHAGDRRTPVAFLTEKRRGRLPPAWSVSPSFPGQRPLPAATGSGLGEQKTLWAMPQRVHGILPGFPRGSADRRPTRRAGAFPALPVIPLPGIARPTVRMVSTARHQPCGSLGAWARLR